MFGLVPFRRRARSGRPVPLYPDPGPLRPPTRNPAWHRPRQSPDNAVVLNGRAYLRSDSALQVLRRLPGWRWAGLALTVPRPLRDWVYTRIARNRYRLFGSTESCLIPDE